MEHAADEQVLREQTEAAARLTDLERLQPENLLRYQPAHAAYDVRFGGKKDARAIAALFRAAAEALPRGGAGNGVFLLALADTLENMDIQLYEHYRVLADLLFEAARATDPAGDAAAACALMKAVRLGLLDGEKYLPPARKAAQSLAAVPFADRAAEEYERTAGL